jgi:hypothetical protein
MIIIGRPIVGALNESMLNGQTRRYLEISSKFCFAPSLGFLRRGLARSTIFLHSKVFELRAGFSISLAATPDAHLVGPRIACRVAIFDSCLPASRRAPSVPPAIADLATQP